MKNTVLRIHICIKNCFQLQFVYGKISPTELEDVIGKHPDVGEVCVIGVPDPYGGDHIPRAFVTIKSETGRRTATAREIEEFANGNQIETIRKSLLP